MSVFQLHISTGNAAFEPSPCRELARILGKLVGNLESQDDLEAFDGDALMDANGNRVGRVTVGEHLNREGMVQVFRGLIERVDEIEAKSSEEERLDSGEALELLAHIRDVCKAAIFGEGGA